MKIQTWWALLCWFFIRQCTKDMIRSGFFSLIYDITSSNQIRFLKYMMFHTWGWLFIANIKGYYVLKSSKCSSVYKEHSSMKVTWKLASFCSQYLSQNTINLHKCTWVNCEYKTSKHCPNKVNLTKSFKHSSKHYMC